MGRNRHIAIEQMAIFNFMPGSAGWYYPTGGKFSDLCATDYEIMAYNWYDPRGNFLSQITVIPFNVISSLLISITTF